MTGEPVSPLLGLLRRRLSAVLLAGLGGAVLGGAFALSRPTTYRTQATLLVVEPRLAAPGTVDFNLTPIRSYVALVASPALAAACRAEVGAGAPARPKVRMPEHTRTIEVVAEGPDPQRLAAFVNCVTSRAREENRKLNEDISQRASDGFAVTLEAIRKEAFRLQGELSALRGSSLVELKRSELKAALQDVERGSDDERRLRGELAAAQARRGRYEELSRQRPELRRLRSFLSRSPEEEASRSESATPPGAAPGVASGALKPETPVLREEADPTRDFADRESATASATERAVVAMLTEARGARVAAMRRAAELEREIAAAEESLSLLRRRFDAAAAAQAELEKRVSLVALENAARAFDLAILSPADPSPPRTGPGPILAALAGFIAAASVAALVVLSR